MGFWGGWVGVVGWGGVRMGGGVEGLAPGFPGPWGPGPMGLGNTIGNSIGNSIK